jgi:hypothetical protein
MGKLLDIEGAGELSSIRRYAVVYLPLSLLANALPKSIMESVWAPR